ncbi:hypothetical protein [Clostridium cochlearium]|jgi:hypothetical protein|uniref:Uncharacterized protein n=1 Tax=Clostridium cochlearium TaxID=1494 RepID=A0A240AQA1_CLOCO|nr:hypothetical protein [Clostridium cochlearium]NSJ91459.1 hypothetical protein [Coprococcus sp. MSK.21.13]MBE6064640.1 hypothetical protein [Clostridium cochlearium]MBU5268409.1 hypothetical protein [Clostridium cochlearium]MCG4578659.1 hypothetical protein [Clostridium cochlearium]MDU1441992.1 hypothetical protein [Clostridium cochlearium]
MVKLCQGKGVMLYNEFSQNKDYIEKALKMDFAEELICIKNISIIPMNKDIYEKYKTNKLKLLVLVAAISFKKEGIKDFDLENILGRINVLLKYYDINYPEKGKNKVYFKPNISRITDVVKIKELESICL